MSDLRPSASPTVAPSYRVARVDRGACDVVPELAPGGGSLRATLAASLLAAGHADPSSSPCVGDRVEVFAWPDGRTTIERVLPRRTAFVRNSVTPGSSHVQVLAANVDYAVIVEGLVPEPDLGRIERLLALAWDSGAQPLIALTKADLAGDAEVQRAEVMAVAPGVDVLLISSVTGLGIDSLASFATAGVTLALLGPSGAGKSTLTNALARTEQMVTRALRADGKGRHTTAHRELVRLPSGACLIDTPGLRSVGLVDVEEALDRVFSDIDELGADCRFADCGHTDEPGCAVLAGVAAGTLAERRLASWRKLQREARYAAMRHDARLRAAAKGQWKSMSKEMRRSGRNRP